MNTTTIDRTKFPRAAEYVERLPNGLLSLTDCLAKRDIYATAATSFPQLVEQPMPSQVRDLLRNHDGWAAESVGTCLSMMIRDFCFDDDAAFREYNKKEVRELYRRPTYRMLMLVMSPSLVVMGAAKRWDAFHKGSKLHSGKTSKNALSGRFEAQLDLEAPEALYPPLTLDVYGDAFVLAIEAAGAKDVAFERGARDKGRIPFRLSWT